MGGAGEPISRKSAAIVAAALLHLTSVVVFIWTDFSQNTNHWLFSVLRTYRNLSGSFRDYTFFAPAVASDLKVAFVLEDTAGRSTVTSFSAKNAEIGFRYNCIIASCLRDAKGRDLFAQSWAALMLGRRDGADRVTVIAKALVVPTMEESRRGRRPEWKTVYAGLFGRRSSPGAR